jgi:putative addiction module CopG family antidote
LFNAGFSRHSHRTNGVDNRVETQFLRFAPVSRSQLQITGLLDGQSFHPMVARLVSCEEMESKVMNIKLTPEQEEIIKEELKSGHFRNVEEVIGEALQVLREKEQSSAAGVPDGAEREAVREMLAFVEKNHVRLEGVSVKDLIHEGHRL